MKPRERAGAGGGGGNAGSAPGDILAVPRGSRIAVTMVLADVRRAEAEQISNLGRE